eukprot:augustus_masked-scaffold_12-processed-gene-7.14-mRNA-1 protein AED:1.00 eAED:1.00 QI:0/-1/0/0/-1/1/1/0/1141
MFDERVIRQPLNCLLKGDSLGKACLLNSLTALENHYEVVRIDAGNESHAQLQQMALTSFESIMTSFSSSRFSSVQERCGKFLLNLLQKSQRCNVAITKANSVLYLKTVIHGLERVFSIHNFKGKSIDSGSSEEVKALGAAILSEIIQFTPFSFVTNKENEKTFAKLDYLRIFGNMFRLINSALSDNAPMVKISISDALEQLLIKLDEDMVFQYLCSIPIGKKWTFLDKETELENAEKLLGRTIQETIRCISCNFLNHRSKVRDATLSLLSNLLIFCCSVPSSKLYVFSLFAEEIDNNLTPSMLKIAFETSFRQKERMCKELCNFLLVKYGKHPAISQLQSELVSIETQNEEIVPSDRVIPVITLQRDTNKTEIETVEVYTILILCSSYSLFDDSGTKESKSTRPLVLEALKRVGKAIDEGVIVGAMQGHEEGRSEKGSNNCKKNYYCKLSLQFVSKMISAMFLRILGKWEKWGNSLNSALCSLKLFLHNIRFLHADLPSVSTQFLPLLTDICYAEENKDSQEQIFKVCEIFGCWDVVAPQSPEETGMYYFMKTLLPSKETNVSNLAPKTGYYNQISEYSELRLRCRNDNQLRNLTLAHYYVLGGYISSIDVDELHANQYVNKFVDFLSKILSDFTALHLFAVCFREGHSGHERDDHGAKFLLFYSALLYTGLKKLEASIRRSLNLSTGEVDELVCTVLIKIFVLRSFSQNLNLKNQNGGSMESCAVRKLFDVLVNVTCSVEPSKQFDGKQLYAVVLSMYAEKILPTVSELSATLYEDSVPVMVLFEILAFMRQQRLHVKKGTGGEYDVLFYKALFAAVSYLCGQTESPEVQLKFLSEMGKFTMCLHTPGLFTADITLLVWNIALSHLAWRMGAVAKTRRKACLLIVVNLLKGLVTETKRVTEDNDTTKVRQKLSAILSREDSYDLFTKLKSNLDDFDEEVRILACVATKFLFLALFFHNSFESLQPSTKYFQDSIFVNLSEKGQTGEKVTQKMKKSLDEFLLDSLDDTSNDSRRNAPAMVTNFLLYKYFTLKSMLPLESWNDNKCLANEVKFKPERNQSINQKEMFSSYKTVFQRLLIHLDDPDSSVCDMVETNIRKLVCWAKEKSQLRDDLISFVRAAIPQTINKQRLKEVEALILKQLD